MTHLIFDTETTDKLVKGATPFDPRQPHLLEIAAVLLDSNFREVDAWVTLVRPAPGVQVSPGALAAHGISTARATAEGVAAHEALQEFNALASRANVLWAYNADFDRMILTIAALRAKVAMPWAAAPLHCAMNLMTEHCKIPSPWGAGYKWPKLQEAHVHATGAPFENAHSALADVRATGRVLKWLSTQANWPYEAVHSSSAAKRPSGLDGVRVMEGTKQAPTAPSPVEPAPAARRETFSIPIAHIQTR